MQNIQSTCEAIAERLLRAGDGRPEAADAARLERHLAACPECRRLAGQLQRLDAGLAIRFTARALTGEFDRTVLARIVVLEARGRQLRPGRQASAERQRFEELARLRSGLRRGVHHALLHLAGLGAVLWAVGRLVPRLVDWAGQFGGAVPGAGTALAALVLAAVAVASAMLVAQTQRTAGAA